MKQKAGLSSRLGNLSPKADLKTLVAYLTPRPGDELYDALSQRRQTAGRLDLADAAHAGDAEFVPYCSERDSLGRLKHLSSRRSTHADTRDLRQPALPKLQQSIYRNMKDDGVTEPLDLLADNKFKVVDGFERQINIIIRNKEFMAFLKAEKSMQAFTREEEHQLGRLSEPAARPGEEGRPARAPERLSRRVRRLL
jgi:hypothetical protein